MPFAGISIKTKIIVFRYTITSHGITVIPESRKSGFNIKNHKKTSENLKQKYFLENDKLDRLFLEFKYEKINIKGRDLTLL